MNQLASELGNRSIATSCPVVEQSIWAIKRVIDRQKGSSGIRFDFHDRTADNGIDASGVTLGDVFAALANGLAAAQCDDIPETGERFTLEEQAASREALLFDFLLWLIYARDARGVRPTVSFSVDDLHSLPDYVLWRWRLLVLFLGMPLHLCDDFFLVSGPYQEHAVWGRTLELIRHASDTRPSSLIHS